MKTDPSTGPAAQAIPIYIINLARRPDRLERIGAHLDGLGLEWQRSDAVDARQTPPQDLDRLVRASGPLGRLGDGDRACTASHFAAWQAFLDSPARFALFLEDDAYLARDSAPILRHDDWIPAGVDVIKLEKFGDRPSRVLLGPPLCVLPNGRALHRLESRHVGGAAYILSRAAAQAALAQRGRVRVPVDHLLFNANVSRLARRFAPAVIRPAMATQRAYGYNSDIAALGKAARPEGWRLKWRRVKRGFHEINRLPRQLALLALGRAGVQTLEWVEDPAGTDPAARAPGRERG
ncbi:glycosyltransferase family 25 protein [Brevirhabdus sp.]|uniref:glycosyltransferase family 25 protein n=1 Tax=Brevirhabdus sp. TaxID=2004514 RepID=UPI004058C6BE